MSAEKASTPPRALDLGDPRTLHVLTTPEGIPLHLEIAPAGDRAGAFLLDALFIVAALIVGFLFVVLLAGLDLDAASVLAMLLFFTLRNFYFIGFELRWRGRTPGKRFFRLQVIDRGGKTLTPEAIFARNLTRELEVFLPFTLMVGGAGALPQVPPTVLPICIIWVIAIVLFPLFSRARVRIGDLAAGTLVVRHPGMLLLDDLAAARRLRPSLTASPAPTRALFSSEQLDQYGIYELHVLEEVLRKRTEQPEAVRAVAEQIAKRIGWQRKITNPTSFLQSFYREQRDHLERKMLFGERRADKAEARRRAREGRAGSDAAGDR